MKTRRRSAAPPTVAAASKTISLEQLERMLVTRSVRVPNDAVLVRETTRALQAMSSGADFATITCEACSEGVRIIEGRDAIEVARMLRARAAWRGDRFWAGELGRRLRFHVVRSTSAPNSGRFGSMARLMSRGAQVATG